MTEHWNGLSPREKIFVIGGAAIIIVFVLFQFVFSPVVDWRRDQERSIVRAEKLYELAVQASASSGTAATADADLVTPVRNVISNTAASRDILLDFVNARDDGSVEVTIGDTSTDNLFGWFANLESEYGVVLSNADVARNIEVQDVANARLVFSRLAG